MSARSALAVFLILVIIAAGSYMAYRSGLLDGIILSLPAPISSLLGSQSVGETVAEGENVAEGEPEVGESSIMFFTNEIQIEYPTLFPNPRWNHMPIKAYMKTDTGAGLASFGEDDIDYVRHAFKVWEEKTGGAISFEEVGSLEEAELIISWFPSLTEIQGGRVVGEGGPTRAVDTGGAFTLIEGGEVFLLPTDNKCVGINRPVHEIGHALGLGHAPPGHGDIMFSKEIDCRQNITQITVDAIGKLYEIPAMPDLVITDLSAVKRGSFVDFNLTIKNIGLKDSVQTTVAFFDDGERIESLAAPRFSVIPRVSPGTGLTSKISGAKVSQDLSELLVVIDSEGGIREMNEGNNEARALFKPG